jgi:hypothetical protein
MCLIVIKMFSRGKHIDSFGESGGKRVAKQILGKGKENREGEDGSEESLQG